MLYVSLSETGKHDKARFNIEEEEPSKTGKLRSHYNTVSCDVTITMDDP